VTIGPLLKRIYSKGLKKRDDRTLVEKDLFKGIEKARRFGFQYPSRRVVCHRRRVESDSVFWIFGVRRCIFIILSNIQRSHRHPLFLLPFPPVISILIHWFVRVSSTYHLPTFLSEIRVHFSDDICQTDAGVEKTTKEWSSLCGQIYSRAI
jgi:hypothetical protein